MNIIDEALIALLTLQQEKDKYNSDTEKNKSSYKKVFDLF
jgi:hypothetical protein